MPHSLDSLGIYHQAIEDELRHLLTPPPDDGPVRPMFEMMRYHLGWVDREFAPLETPLIGKRLRPVLCLLACEGVGGDWHRATPAAAAIELIHNFSLIHDDIEDGDRFRHHRPTVWHIWGIAQGINTGDALWTLARLAIHRLAQQGYSAETILTAIEWLDSACLELCSGQFLDLLFEEAASVSPEEYMRMIEGKTAALLAASMGLGALLGGAPTAAVQAMTQFGRQLGLAFQITDDLLGIWGTPSITGKPVASDILAGKKSLPIALAMQREAERGQKALAERYAQRDGTPEGVAEIVGLIEATGARERSQEMAASHLRRALSFLGAVAIKSSIRDQLGKMALDIGGRTF